MAVLQKKTPPISIVIINYRTPELVLSLLEKLGTIAPHEIILVDHSPTDEIRNKLPSVSEISYYYQRHNSGFAAGNN
jgi:GT2 family glycosyltransferase